MRIVSDKFRELTQMLKEKVLVMEYSIKERVNVMEKGVQHILMLMDYGMKQNAERINSASRVLERASPMQILKLGYSIVRTKKRIIRSVTDVKIGDTLETMFQDGAIESKIISNKKNK